MLREMRKGVRGVLSWAIVLTVVAGFVFWGVADYFGAGKSRSIAAKVNGQKIPWATVDLLYSRLQNQLGENAETKMVKQDIRRLLIQRIALIQSISKLGFQVNDEQVAQTILQIPAFQVEGRFSKDRFQEVLRQNSLSEANIRSELKEEILLRQLEQGIAQSSFSLKNELKGLIGLLEQKRDIGYVIVPSKKYQAEIKLDPKDVQAYYEEHQSDFILPEQVSLSYVELSVEDLAKAIQLDEITLKKHYEEHISAYTAPERVRARHILIPLSDKSDEALREAEAKEKVQKLLARIKAGESFAKLARTESSDKGSAEKGGDLGWFTRGQMVPAFEDVAFALKKPNQVSEAIRTQFGYHIIQLIEHKQTEVRSYAEVKELVKEQLSQEEARKIFADRTEMLAKLAFENSTSLEPIVSELGLKIRDTELFSRHGGGALGLPIILI